MSETSDMIRKSFFENDEIRDSGLTAPKNLILYRDIPYGEEKTIQLLDVYKPKNYTQKLPVIVSVHGGGWVYGDKERYQYYCMNLAQRGFAVVNFTYRLAPEYKFPAPMEDTSLVFKWVIEHADEYGMDVNNIFAVGDSAGANTLAIYTAMCLNSEFAARFPFALPKGGCPKAMALNCGAYVFEKSEEDDLTMKLMEDFLPDGEMEAGLELLTVPSHITENYPPVFLMSATGDFLRNQVSAIEAKLIEKKIPFEFHFYGDAKNNLGHVFHLNMKIEDAKICNDEECMFFKKYI